MHRQPSSAHASSNSSMHHFSPEASLASFAAAAHTTSLATPEDGPYPFSQQATVAGRNQIHGSKSCTAAVAAAAAAGAAPLPSPLSRYPSSPVTLFSPGGRVSPAQLKLQKAMEALKGIDPQLSDILQSSHSTLNTGTAFDPALAHALSGPAPRDLSSLPAHSGSSTPATGRFASDMPGSITSLAAQSSLPGSPGQPPSPIAQLFTQPSMMTPVDHPQSPAREQTPLPHSPLYPLHPDQTPLARSPSYPLQHSQTTLTQPPPHQQSVPHTIHPHMSTALNSDAPGSPFYPATPAAAAGHRTLSTSAATEYPSSGGMHAFTGGTDADSPRCESPATSPHGSSSAQQTAIYHQSSHVGHHILQPVAAPAAVQHAPSTPTDPQQPPPLYRPVSHHGYPRNQMTISLQPRPCSSPSLSYVPQPLMDQNSGDWQAHSYSPPGSPPHEISLLGHPSAQHIHVHIHQEYEAFRPAPPPLPDSPVHASKPALEAQQPAAKITSPHGSPSRTALLRAPTSPGGMHGASRATNDQEHCVKNASASDLAKQIKRLKAKINQFPVQNAPKVQQAADKPHTAHARTVRQPLLTSTSSLHLPNDPQNGDAEPLGPTKKQQHQYASPQYFEAGLTNGGQAGGRYSASLGNAKSPASSISSGYGEASVGCTGSGASLVSEELGSDVGASERGSPRGLQPGGVLHISVQDDGELNSALEDLQQLQSEVQLLRGTQHRLQHGSGDGSPTLQRAATGKGLRVAIGGEQHTTHSLHHDPSNAPRQSDRQLKRMHRSVKEANELKAAAERERDVLLDGIRSMGEQASRMKQEMAASDVVLRTQVQDTQQQKLSIQTELNHVLEERQELLHRVAAAELEATRARRQVDDMQVERVRQERLLHEVEQARDRSETRVQELEVLRQMAREQLNDMELDNRRLQRGLEDAERETIKYRQLHTDSGEQCNALRQELAALNSNSEHLEMNYTKAFGDLETLTSTYNELLQEYQSLQGQHGGVSQQLVHLQDEHAATCREAAALQESHAALQAEAQTLQTRHKEVLQEVQQLQSALDTCQLERQSLYSEVRGIQQDNDKLQRALQSCMDELLEERSRCSKLQVDNDMAGEKLRQALAQSFQAQRALEASQDTQSKFEAEHVVLAQEKAELAAVLARHQQKYSALEHEAHEARREAAGDLAAMQMDLSVAQQKAEDLQRQLDAQLAEHRELQLAADQEHQFCQQLLQEREAAVAEASQVPGLRESIAILEARLQDMQAHLEEQGIQQQGVEEELQHAQAELQQHFEAAATKEQQLDAADVLGQTVILRCAWRRWRCAVNILQHMHQLVTIAQQWNTRMLLRRWMRHWTLASVRSRAMSRLEARHLHRLKQAAFGVFAKHALHRRWKSKRQGAALIHHRKRLLASHFQGWLHVRQVAVTEEQECLPAMTAASFHHISSLVHRAMHAWMEWFKSFKLPWVLRAKRARRLYDLFMRRRALAAWRSRVFESLAAKKARCQVASLHRYSRVLNRAWCAWLHHLAFKHDSRRASCVAVQHLAHRLLLAWRYTVLCKQMQLQKVHGFQAGKRRAFKGRVLQAWLQQLSRCKKHMAANGLALQHRQACVLQRVFISWRHHTMAARTHTATAAAQSYTNLRKVVERWSKLSWHLGQWYQVKKRASCLATRLQLQVQRGVMRDWHRLACLEHDHRYPVLCALHALLVKQQQRKSLLAWHRCCVHVQRNSYFKLDDALRHNQALCHELQVELASCDESRSQLQDQVQELVQRLSHEVEEFQGSERLLQTQLSNARAHEAALAAQVDTLRCSLAAAQTEANTTREQMAQLTNNMEEEVQESSTLACRLKDAQERCNQLEQELGKMAATLETAAACTEQTTKQLRDCIVASDQQVLDLKDKLNNAYEALSHKEESIVQLRDALTIARAELTSTKERLAQALKEAAHQLKAGDERIMVLEGRIQEAAVELLGSHTHHTNEISEMQEELDRARSIIEKQRVVIKQSSLFVALPTRYIEEEPREPRMDGVVSHIDTGKLEDVDNSIDQYPITTFIARRASTVQQC